VKNVRHDIDRLHRPVTSPLNTPLPFFTASPKIPPNVQGESVFKYYFHLKALTY